MANLASACVGGSNSVWGRAEVATDSPADLVQLPKSGYGLEVTCESGKLKRNISVLLFFAFCLGWGRHLDNALYQRPRVLPLRSLQQCHIPRCQSACPVLCFKMVTGLHY